MNGKSLGRHITDLIMVVCLAALMLYFRTGQTIHEWLGVAALAFFVLHHVWNRKWFLSLGKGPLDAGPGLTGRAGAPSGATSRSVSNDSLAPGAAPAVPERGGTTGGTPSHLHRTLQRPAAM